MKITYKLLIIMFTILLAGSNIFASGGNRNGTAGATELLIPVGVRGIAMSSANVATSYGVEALFWNPAGVAKMEGSTDLMFSHMSYIADIGVDYGAVAANFGDFGVVSFNIKSLSMGEILITTTQNPDGTGATFTPQMITAGLSYSKQLTDRIAVGVTANYISETIDEVSATGFAFNVGAVYDNLGDIDGLSFGIVLKNIGPQMKFTGSGLNVFTEVTNFNRPNAYYNINTESFELPSSFEIGFGYKPVLDEVNSLQFSGTFQNNNFSGDEYKGGIEYGYNDMFFIRGGYSYSETAQNEDYIYGFSAGAGIHYDIEGISVTVDYAYRDVDFFDANHVFGLTLGF